MIMTISEMKEMNSECCQLTCNDIGTHLVYWPGQGKKRMCKLHAEKARRIAGAMGFSLHIEDESDKFLK